MTSEYQVNTVSGTMDEKPGIPVDHGSVVLENGNKSWDNDTKIDPAAESGAGSQGALFEEDENKDRGNWSGKLDFILSCIGFAVGLGNVWRFPYLCYRNGGGAFLIPYAIMLAVAGLPLFYFELALGQYSSSGPIDVWNVSPAFRGLGYAMISISGMVCIYYNVIMMYVVFYFFASFTSKLPWSDCTNTWNTPYCVDQLNDTTKNITWNGTQWSDGETMRTTPADEYFTRFVLDISDGMENMGMPRWQLFLCLLFAWVVVYLCIIKGIKSTGKVVYFTALFPYVVLFILLCRGATLDGSLEGIKFYIVPDFNRLKDAKVWGDAAVQIFYSLGPAWGGLMTMASYNKFHNNAYRDAVIVAIVNCGTSVFAGFVIFSVIGFMAHELDVDVGNVTASGPGLAFVAYPAGIAMMPGAPFWSILFFFMLFTLGLDSMFAMMETVLTAIVDLFPDVLRARKPIFTAVLCTIGLGLGIPQTTRGGIYLMNLMDWYSASFSLMIVSFFELTVVMYIYGFKRFMDDVEYMVGTRPNPYWIVTWLAVTPITVILIIVFNIWQYTPVYYGDYEYPYWAEVLGFLMIVFPMCWLPFWMIVSFVQSGAKFNALTFKGMFHANSKWGPALDEHREGRESRDLKIAPLSYSTKSPFDNPGYNGSTPSVAPVVQYNSNV